MVDLARIECPVILRGNQSTAYRDPVIPSTRFPATTTRPPASSPCADAGSVRHGTNATWKALAEKMHAQARHDWVYGADEDFDNPALIAEKYRGIRPAFGYPACPDHLPKRILFDLLDAPEQGIELTESCAMTPAASVSGLYFAHPEARYFTVGRLGSDQVADYARRSGRSLGEIERWLASNLGYEPEPNA